MNKKDLKTTIKIGLNLGFFLGHHLIIQKVYNNNNHPDKPISFKDSLFNLQIKYAHLASWVSAFVAESISDCLPSDSHYLLKDSVDLLGSLLISSFLGQHIYFDSEKQQYIESTDLIPCPIPALAYSLINSNLLDKGLDYLLDNCFGNNEGGEELDSSDTMLPLEVF